MSYEFTAPVKDPDSRLLHSHDLRSWLQAGEAITAQSILSAPAGLTIDQVTQAGGIVSYRIAGGTLGATYIVTCRITTSAGRIDERSVRYVIGQR